MKKLLTFSLLVHFSFAFDHAKVNRFFVCHEATSVIKVEGYRCNAFFNYMIDTHYGITPYMNEKGMIRDYLIAGEIKNDSHWKVIGKATDQEALEKAQETANRNIPVIALWSNPQKPQTGQSAFIIPGKLSPSGSWGLKVPHAINYQRNSKKNSFIGKKLSYAFGKDKKESVTLHYYQK